MRFRLTLLALLVGWMPLVHATETTYTSRSAFNAATTNDTTLTFEGLVTSGSATQYPSPPGITTGGINFQSTSNQLYAIDPSHGFSWNFPSGQFLDDNNYTASSSLNITLLPTNTTAIGGDWGLQTGNTATSF